MHRPPEPSTACRSWSAVCLRGLKSLAIALLVAGTTWVADAEETHTEVSAETLEYQLKAGFLINFAKFVQWPTNMNRTTNEFRIGILADPRAYSVLESALEGKPLDNRTVRVSPVNNSNAAAQCQLLFVARTDSPSARKLWSDIKPQLATLPVLTVGEEAGFAAHGGCINLIKQEQRIRFEINLKVAETAGLKVSAKLASMARRVETEATP